MKRGRTKMVCCIAFALSTPQYIAVPPNTTHLLVGGTTPKEGCCIAEYQGGVMYCVCPWCPAIQHMCSGAGQPPRRGVVLRDTKGIEKCIPRRCDVLRDTEGVYINTCINPKHNTVLRGMCCGVYDVHTQYVMYTPNCVLYCHVSDGMYCRVPMACIAVYLHTATHCNTLQRTATHCNTLQHTTTQCNTLQHTATHCNTLQRTATHCNTLQHTAILTMTLGHRDGRHELRAQYEEASVPPCLLDGNPTPTCPWLGRCDVFCVAALDRDRRPR